MAENLVRDVLELAIVVAIGGMLLSASKALWRREITVFRCPECRRPTSRVYPHCKHCGAAVEASA